MQQLSSTDGQLLHVETENTPEHIGTLTIYDQSTAEGGIVRFKDILRRFETRLDRSPIFINKVAKVPFNLDQPFWIPDPKFDLEYHLRHIALPQPGDWRQLCIQVARLHAQQLDLTIPLWQAYVIEGLDNVEGVPKGSFAVYMKIHHAAADGMAFGDMYSCLHDLKPLKPQGDYGTIVSQWDSPKEPSRIKLLGAASRHLIRLPFDIASTTISLLPSYLKSRQMKDELDYQGVHSKPMTRFDGPISRNRVFNGLDFKMEEVKAIRASVPGCTLNDVAVAIVSGGVRHYLKTKHSLPDKSLVGWIPVNIRSEEDKGGKSGNAFGIMTTAIHTEISDPIKRLQAVAETNVKAKKLRQVAGEDLVKQVTDMVPAPLQKYMGSISSLSAKMGSSAVPANLTISNVPNSPVPIYLAGAKAVKFQCLGLLQHGHGLFHIVTSYCDTFSISFLSCRDQMPDPQFYAECMELSFAELKAASNELRREQESQEKPAKEEKKPAAKTTRAKKSAPARKRAPSKAKVNTAKEEPAAAESTQDSAASDS